MSEMNNYEFSEVDNVMFKSLSKYFILAGSLMLILNFWNFDLNNPILAVIDTLELIAGASFLFAGFSFKSVASTSGNDIVHLVIALKKLKTSMFSYTILYIIIFFIQIYAKYFFKTTN